jgi:serpin B
MAMNLKCGKKWPCFLVVVAMSFLAPNCPAQSGTSNDQQQLAFANAGFGFRLLKELEREQLQANVFISPYSISSVLQMVSTGARGQTLEEFQQVLATDGLSPGRMNQAYQSLADSITNAQTNAILNIANALWYRTGSQINQDFAAVNGKFYQATLRPLDFSDPQSAQVMNDWAALNTSGRIKTILQPPIPAGTAIIIANAIYFKGTWEDQFDPKQTKPRAFRRNSGNEVQLPMMQQAGTFSYQEGNGFQAVQLPYAGKRLQMQVLLPATNSSLDELVARLDAQMWQSTILPQFKERRGTVVLPRFTLRYGAELKPCLVALGLKDAWNADANFLGMSSNRLFLSEVRHQSFVEVNEQGTEAAAVTTGVMALASFRNEPPPFQMIVDRPFLFLILDRVTGSILFIGVVFDPGAAGP